MFGKFIVPFMFCFPVVVSCTTPNYVNPDPKQQPIIKLPETEPILDLPGVCLPTGNGTKDEATLTYCGSEGSQGRDFDINKNGDKFKAILHRENQSKKWSIDLVWDAKDNVVIKAFIGEPDAKTQKSYFHTEMLTGKGEKTLKDVDFLGKPARYFAWQAYRMK